MINFVVDDGFYDIDMGELVEFLYKLAENSDAVEQDWLDGYNTAIDEVIEYIESKYTRA